MRIVVESMTRREAAASRRPELREMKLVIHQANEAAKPYWKPDCHGYTENIEEAGLYSLTEALGYTNSGNPYTFLFIREGEPEPGPDGKVRRYLAKMVLGHSLYAMVEANPNNPAVRAHIMARVGHMPKDDLDTLQKIVDWIECDVEILGAVEVGQNVPSPVLATPAAPATPQPAFIVMTRNSELEKGTCSYRQTNRSQSQVPITHQMIMDAVGNSDDFDTIVDCISQEVEEKASDYESDHDTTGLDHDDYEATETEDREVEFSRRELSEQIAEYLRAQLSREELEDLDL